MSRIMKVSGIAVLVIVLLVSGVIPAFAYTSFSTAQYSTRGNIGYYTPGSGTYIYQYSSSRPVVKPPVAPPPVVPPRPVTPPPVAPPPPVTNPGAGLSAEEAKMVNLVNQERQNQGIRPLSVNQTLVQLARQKSQDMIAHNYFGHTSPTYGSPFDMMSKAGVAFKTGGENIAGAATTESAHQSLMNSPG
ncbi:MAG TPA: CAP domain-containing protein, partial [Bacillota bacterium]|nr:CAP domain-containing protein [Bacillota bacterium]